MNIMRLSELDTKWYADWRFWLLVISINISGNPGFNVVFPYYATLTGLFVGLLSYLLSECPGLSAECANLCAPARLQA